MTKLHMLNEIGQSIWYDNIRRALLDSGELAELIGAGVTGVTSNPTIFEKAIVGSTDYDQALYELVDQDLAVPEIYERLALQDIARTADLLKPVYDRTAGRDGFVSIEVSPTLAYDTEGTVLEARRLFEELSRPNVMIKVPATSAGIPAVETLTSDGLNINITLIFGLSQYRQVVEAYLAGLEQRLERGESIAEIASVASFFVSRVDTAVNRTLHRIGVGSAAASDLMGRIAIANAKQAYRHFRSVVAGERWQRLSQQGGSVQRPLWASTSSKNPEYSDTLYVDSLIGPDTVNTVPPATLRAFLDHGRVAQTIDGDMDQALRDLQTLAGLGVDLNAISEELIEEGVAGFADSFQMLMAAIAQKRERLLAGWKQITADLGRYRGSVEQAMQEVQRQAIVARIWNHDHTVWDPEPAEIENRLGWLTTAEVMLDNLHRLQALTDGVRADGYQQLVLLGMGGSSLAAEVFHRTYGVRGGYLSFQLLDSTDPQAVLALERGLELERTLFIVATKSGGTVETLSLFKYFYNRVAEVEGVEGAGPHFLAITDPGSALAGLAECHDFRAIFLNDPDIGGRYSALSYFGLVPAALMGVELRPILEQARAAACASDSCVEADDNPAVFLGCAMAELAKAGRDKLTLVTSPQIESFGDWVEQLVAESTGKQRTGILPVVGERLGEADSYADDRLFVQLELEGVGGREAEPEFADRHRANGPGGEDVPRERLRQLVEAGYPLIRIRLQDRYDLGGQFFLWEMATAVAGHRLGIHPFNQPNVESAKRLARQLVEEFAERGRLAAEQPVLRHDGLELYGSLSGSSISEALEAFLAAAQPGSYVAVQAYLPPTEGTSGLLQAIRHALRRRTRLATTLGYGPRYLHSTGQLHKGDAGHGLFIQITADDPEDVDIPGEPGGDDASLSFGTLKAAQAIGDRRALEQGGRSVLRIHLAEEVGAGLQRVLSAVRP